MVVTSIVGFLSFSDFGIGIGLRNMLIECAGNDDIETPKKLIGNALVVLFGIFFFISIIVFFVFPLLSWDQLIKCQHLGSVPHILPTMQSVIFMFALGLPVAQLQNIANAYQRGYWGYFCLFVGRVLGFLFVIWCVFAGQPLWLLAGGYIGFPTDWFRFVTDWPRPVFDRAVADLVKQGRAVLEAAAFMVCLLPVLPADTTDVDA